MDKAPDFGSGDCRFETCQGWKLFVAFMQDFAVGDIMYIQANGLILHSSVYSKNCQGAKEEYTKVLNFVKIHNSFRVESHF